MSGVSSLRVDVEQRFASGFVVAASLDVALAPGSMVVLCGPSGAGKTTVLRQIAGLERPGRGFIRFGAETWCDTAAGVWQPPQRRRTSVVFQQPTLFPHLTVAGNIHYGIQVSDTYTTRLKVEEVATMLGVRSFENRYPRSLSSGEAQRVAVARALAPGPQLLLLDEPFAALDAPTRMRLRRDVRALLQRIQTPAILVTHDRSEALAMGDQIVVMIGGRVRQVGAVADVFSHPVDADVAASLGVESVLPARIIEASEGLLSVAVGADGATVLHVAERDPLPVGADVYACIRAEDVTLETQSPAHASVRNHLVARVVSVTPEGPIDRISLDCGFPLDAVITRRSREELNLTVGAPITAAVKATSIHLVARG